MHKVFKITFLNKKIKFAIFFAVIFICVFILPKQVYAQVATPTLTSISASPSSVSVGSTITITPTLSSGQSSLSFKCNEDNNFGIGGTNLCTQAGTNYSSPYTSMTCTYAAPSGSISRTVYCKVYNGTYFSTPAKQATYALITSAPSKPQNLIVTPYVDTTNLYLTWDAPSSNGGTAINGYKIERCKPTFEDALCQDESNWASLDTATGLTYTDPNLTTMPMLEDAEGAVTTWFCQSPDCGTNATCMAKRITVPVDGVCSSSYNNQNFYTLASSSSLCSTGNVLNFTTTATGWTWQCSNQYNGAIPNCLANKKIDGVCGAAAPPPTNTKTYDYTGSVNTFSVSASDNSQLCAAGSPSVQTVTLGISGPDATWTCIGTSGGVTSPTCTVKRGPACATVARSTTQPICNSSLCLSGSCVSNNDTAYNNSTNEKWSWKCQGDTGTDPVICYADLKGDCGTANGHEYAYSTTADPFFASSTGLLTLCRTTLGTNPTTLAGPTSTTSATWYCKGTTGDSLSQSDQCSATRTAAPVPGACGPVVTNPPDPATTVGSTIAIYPYTGSDNTFSGVSQLCASGSLYDSTGNTALSSSATMTLNATGPNVSWMCKGQNGSATNATCTVKRAPACAPADPTATQPICNSSLCLSGSCTANSDTNFNNHINQQWSWKCTGDTGAGTTICYSPLNGTCGDYTYNLTSYQYLNTASAWHTISTTYCATGSPSNSPLFSSLTSNNPLSWTCNGVGTGYNSQSCQATKAGSINGVCGANGSGYLGSATVRHYASASYSAWPGIGATDFCTSGSLSIDGTSALTPVNSTTVPGFPSPSSSSLFTTWYCLGSGTGATTPTCYAYLDVDGACNTNVAKTYDYNSGNSNALTPLCNSGDPYNIDTSGVLTTSISSGSLTLSGTAGQTANWKCKGKNNGANSATCTATRNYPDVTALCAVLSPTSAIANIGDSVTFRATPGGGRGVGTYSYSWSGDNGLSGTTSTTSAISYTSSGVKNAYVTVTSNSASTTSTSCPVTIRPQCGTKGTTAGRYYVAGTSGWPTGTSETFCDAGSYPVLDSSSGSTAQITPGFPSGGSTSATWSCYNLSGNMHSDLCSAYLVVNPACGDAGSAGTLANGVVTSGGVSYPQVGSTGDTFPAGNYCGSLSAARVWLHPTTQNTLGTTGGSYSSWSCGGINTTNTVTCYAKRSYSAVGASCSGTSSGSSGPINLPVGGSVSVLWSAVGVTGGVSPYSYSWSEVSSMSNPFSSYSSATKNYTTTGTKTVYFKVTDSASSTVTPLPSCSIDIKQDGACGSAQTNSPYSYNGMSTPFNASQLCNSGVAYNSSGVSVADSSIALSANSGASLNWQCRGLNGGTTPSDCTATRLSPPVVDSLVANETDCGFNGNSTLKLNWKYSSAGGFAEKKFDLEIAHSNTFSSSTTDFSRTIISAAVSQSFYIRSRLLNDGSNEILFNSANLPAGTKYYWRIRVYDTQDQNSGWVYYGGTSTTTDANGNKIYSGTILSSSAITFNPPLHAWPYAVISLTPPEPVAKQQVTFSGLGSSCYNASGAVTCPSNAYQWYNLDTNPKTTGSSAPTFVTTYPVLGSHSEQLVVTDLEGNSCSATTSFTVKSPSDVPQWKEISPF